MRYGSLFSGFGGLDLAVEEVFGAESAWHCENEPAACKVLAKRWPNVPNLGDVTKVDWSTVERPAILLGGFPCTDVSAAGKRAGLNPGTRSGLWSHFADAIRALEPKLVVIENVRGLLSTEAFHPAHDDVGFCPWCLGNAPGGIVLRALGAVLGDLADLGFDAEWVGLPASAVGAPHPRFRIFIIAWPAQDSDSDRPEPSGSTAPREAESRWARPDADGRSDVPAAAPPGGGYHGGMARENQRWIRSADGGQPAADTNGEGPQGRECPTGSARAQTAGDGRHADKRGSTAWGDYGPAVRRWESILGRVAPPPTIIGARGRPKLSPYFVEWMMGLPDGWVTETGLLTITRMGVNVNAMLKMLGNGVVPQQAAHGLRILLDRMMTTMEGE